MSDSRFVKAKTDGEIMPSNSQRPALRRTKTVDRFFAGLREEEEARQYQACLDKMPVIDETLELKRLVPKEELQARVQLLGDLLTGQKKQSDVEESNVDAPSAAIAPKM